MAILFAVSKPCREKGIAGKGLISEASCMIVGECLAPD